MAIAAKARLSHRNSSRGGRRANRISATPPASRIAAVELTIAFSDVHAPPARQHRQLVARRDGHSDEQHGRNCRHRRHDDGQQLRLAIGRPPCPVQHLDQHGGKRQRSEADDPAVVDPGDRLRRAHQRATRGDGARIGQQISQAHQGGKQIGGDQQQHRAPGLASIDDHQQEAGHPFGDEHAAGEQRIEARQLGAGVTGERQQHRADRQIGGNERGRRHERRGNSR